MKFNRIQILLASLALIGSSVMARELEPRQLMAQLRPPLHLDQMIPTRFGTWTLVPEISPVMPAEPEGYVETDAYSKVYSQEVSRGYTDGHGNIVMLLVAYGPVQNYRLKAHRPEMCYTAAGFRVSDKVETKIDFGTKTTPLDVTRLVAERESRLEPISYWMRVGDNVSNGVVQRQMIRLRYGLKGLIPDGALIRVSTVGLPREASFQLQDQFIHDLLGALSPDGRKFFVGVS